MVFGLFGPGGDMIFKPETMANRMANKKVKKQEMNRS
jgi:hypothetical protein